MTTFPISGTFTSKRGTRWNYIIHSDLTVEQWHNTTKRIAGGWKDGPDVYTKHCTKELRTHIKSAYGLEVR